jgi:16S rRNA (uracil1498-N3)-methyltransferase
MAHFYISDELESTSVGSIVMLHGAEGHHASTVSRVRVGEKLAVGNGRGLLIQATVTATSKDSVELLVQTFEQIIEQQPRMILVQALAKSDRDERAVEASTELGIDVVIPWAADRSISKWEGPKIEKGLTRWSAIVREATKQSIRAYIPLVEPLMKTSNLISRLDGLNVLVLDPTGTQSLSSVVLDHRDIALIVGPEGGITDNEITQFARGGATIVTMGSNILRTSTAGPAALAILNAKLGRC